MRIMKIMSDINNELIRESIYEQVLDEYPKLSEDEQIKIAEKRFEELSQWVLMILSWDNIYDALEAIESIIEFDPTPQYLYDDTGGEPPISAEERSREAFEQKLIDKR